MTLTDTVTSFAHDAAHTASGLASDLGSQAVELGKTAADLGKDLGKTAADLGKDAASSVSSAASQLAHTLSNKTPAVHTKSSKKPWVIVALIVAIFAGAAVFRSKREAKRVDGLRTSPSAVRDADDSSTVLRAS